MGKRIDLTGMDFNWLHVDSFAYAGGGKSKKAFWNCTCKCGRKTVVESLKLRNGSIKSCGCYKKISFRERVTIHGATANGKRERLYSIWHDMRKRCNNPNTFGHKHYYDRGIRVCREWNNYEVFAAWAIHNGYDDTLTIDRIDVNKGYSPDNCRWVTKREQSWNTTRNFMVEYKGETKSLPEWCDILNLNRGKVYFRIKKGNWDVERAFETP